MHNPDLPIYDRFDNPGASWTKDQGASGTAEIIDLSHLVAEFSLSRSSGVRRIGATTLGELLQALPIGSLLVDDNHTIIYANQAWKRMSPHYENILHRPFHTLFPNPSTSFAIQSLVQNVFLARRPQVMKGLLRIDHKEMWSRVHLMSVGLGGDVAILVLVEDLTDGRQLIPSDPKQPLDATPTQEMICTDEQSPNSEKRRIDALDALLDLHRGMTSTQLMTKHGLSPRGLKSLLVKLREVRDTFGLSDADLDRLGTAENKVRKLEPPLPARQDPAFSGILNNMDILECLQLMMLSGKMVVLKVSSRDGEHGLIFIDRGSVRHAKCGQLEGNEALFKCLSFESGTFVNLPWHEPDAITINMPGDLILMEAARKRDEARAVATKLSA